LSSFQRSHLILKRGETLRDLRKKQIKTRRLLVKQLLQYSTEGGREDFQRSVLLLCSVSPRTSIQGGLRGWWHDSLWRLRISHADRQHSQSLTSSNQKEERKKYSQKLSLKVRRTGLKTARRLE